MADGTFDYLVGASGVELGVEDGDLVVRTGGSESARVKANGTATGAWATAGGNGGSSSALKLAAQTQAAHGFTVGALTPVRNDGSSWVKSEGDTLAHAFVHGIAIATDANTFDLYLPGSDVPTTGATGAIEYLSPTSAGTMTTIQPSTPGQIIASLGVYTNATTFLFQPLGPQYIATTPYMKQAISHATAVTVANLAYFCVPSDLNGSTLYSAELMFEVAPTGGPVEVTLKNNAGLEMFSTRPKTAVNKTNNTLTGGVAAVVNPANAVVATGDVLTLAGTLANTNADDGGCTLLTRWK